MLVEGMQGKRMRLKRPLIYEFDHTLTLDADQFSYPDMIQMPSGTELFDLLERDLQQLRHLPGKQQSAWPQVVDFNALELGGLFGIDWKGKPRCSSNGSDKLGTRESILPPLEWAPSRQAVVEAFAAGKAAPVIGDGDIKT